MEFHVSNDRFFVFFGHILIRHNDADAIMEVHAKKRASHIPDEIDTIIDVPYE